MMADRKIDLGDDHIDWSGAELAEAPSREERPVAYAAACLAAGDTVTIRISPSDDWLTVSALEEREGGWVQVSYHVADGVFLYPVGVVTGLRVKART